MSMIRPFVTKASFADKQFLRILSSVRWIQEGFKAGFL